MVSQDALLVTLVNLVERLPMPPTPQHRRRGHPQVYSDRLFLKALVIKALVIMIVRHLHHVHALLSVLAQPTTEMQHLRDWLSEQGPFPARRTWERRLKALPDSWPAQIGCLGRYLIDLIEPWATWGRAVAIDSTVLQSRGGVWHHKHREKGEIPQTSIDPEAHWTTSGWHGWVYGWKLHVVCAVAAVWVPIAAVLTAANVAESEPAPALLGEVPTPPKCGSCWGDRHYNTPDLHALCQRDDRVLVATKYGGYPHTDDGVEVRRVFHKLRALAIENFNEQFQGIFDGQGQVPTKGLLATQRFALGAIFVYQLAFLYRFEHDQELCVGLKAFLKAA